MKALAWLVVGAVYLALPAWLSWAFAGWAGLVALAVAGLFFVLWAGGGQP